MDEETLLAGILDAYEAGDEEWRHHALVYADWLDEGPLHERARNARLIAEGGVRLVFVGIQTHPTAGSMLDWLIASGPTEQKADPVMLLDYRMLTRLHGARYATPPTPSQLLRQSLIDLFTEPEVAARDVIEQEYPFSDWSDNFDLTDATILASNPIIGTTFNERFNHGNPLATYQQWKEDVQASKLPPSEIEARINEIFGGFGRRTARA